jgi:hypothetical protein
MEEKLESLLGQYVVVFATFQGRNQYRAGISFSFTGYLQKVSGSYRVQFESDFISFLPENVNRIHQSMIELS